MEEAQSSITSDGAASSLDHNATAKTNATEGLMTEQELEHSLLVFYLVIFVMLAAQSALVAWRKRHRRSYDLVTLVGLWSIPPIIALYLGFWRFLAIWSLYSGITGNFLYRCAYARSTDKKLPKKVYRWFFSTFKASVAVGVIGYALLLIQIFLSGMLVTPAMDPSWALIACFYGLYFGILTRDCAEVAGEQIATRLGTARRMGVSVRDCALCGNELRNALSSDPTQASFPEGATSAVSAPFGDKTADGGFAASEATVQLSCKHLFHSDCIRGWTIIGKKEECPACGEKVDLRALYADKPWETRNLSWTQMLDMFRYMLVWNPAILTMLHFVLHGLHLDEPVHGADTTTGKMAGLNGTVALDNTTFGRNDTMGMMNTTTGITTATAL